VISVGSHVRRFAGTPLQLSPRPLLVRARARGPSACSFRRTISSREGPRSSARLPGFGVALGVKPSRSPGRGPAAVAARPSDCRAIASGCGRATRPHPADANVVMDAIDAIEQPSSSSAGGDRRHRGGLRCPALAHAGVRRISSGSDTTAESPRSNPSTKRSVRAPSATSLDLGRGLLVTVAWTGRRCRSQADLDLVARGSGVTGRRPPTTETFGSVITSPSNGLDATPLSSAVTVLRGTRLDLAIARRTGGSAWPAGRRQRPAWTGRRTTIRGPPRRSDAEATDGAGNV